MYQRNLTDLGAGAILLAFAITLSGSALAQKEPTTDSKNLNSSRSNVDRMGGGGGGKGAAGVTTVKGSNSNSSDRMGAGGAGKGSVQLNPQPEPPGRR